MILDGWGISPDPSISAIAQAQTPFIDSLYKNYPHATLRTDGMNVGLPDGQMGNSEVGHINLGAGRIVYQDLAKINMAIEDGSLKTHPELLKAFEYAKTKEKKLHFIGLVSDGGVHAHINHLKGLLTAAQEFGIADMFVHAFTDGRDVDPNSGKGHIQELQDHLKTTGGKIASIIGRYYAMDRDRRWERVRKAYDLLCHGIGEPATNPVESIEKSYRNGVTDEFIEPISMRNSDGTPVATMEEGDVVIFFNFRTDRGRQLTEALSQKNFDDFGMKALPLYFVTLTNYDASFKNVHVIYDKENLHHTLGEVLAQNNKTQLRIAETEKYPHVTYFFSGGRELPFPGESRILCPSPTVATYDLKPEMSAYDIRDKVIPEIREKSADFICLNFANADMVGHTGVFKAAIKACETVDSCANAIIENALENGYTTLVIADHGNSDTMRNPDGSPNTAHTTNPVPIIVVDEEIKSVKDGILSDIAPTILHLMGIAKPNVMDRESLL